MKYDYLIAYSFDTKTKSGTGRMLITHIKKIKSTRDIEEIESYLKRKIGAESLVVINYQIIKKHWR
jgi:hypothetical protein